MTVPCFVAKGAVYGPRNTMTRCAVRTAREDGQREEQLARGRSRVAGARAHFWPSYSFFILRHRSATGTHDARSREMGIANARCYCWFNFQYGRVDTVVTRLNCAICSGVIRRMTMGNTPSVQPVKKLLTLLG